MQITANVLEAQPLLRGMSAQHLELLARDSMAAEFKVDELILAEGSPANRFYLILEGSVSIESETENGEMICIENLGVGDTLGWSWLFPPYYWHFDARAVRPTKAIFFYGTHLRELCEENHDFGFELMKRVSDVLVKRLRATRRQLVKQNTRLLFPI